MICLGLILDEKGEKMSKSKGNVVDPWDVLNTHGADAFRWYLFTSGPPGEPRRFSKDLVGKVISNFWLTLWNTYSFFVTYANLDNWTPSTDAPTVADRDPLDQWVLAELHQLVGQVTESFDNYDVPGATRPIQAFIESLSNWYLRLSRRRFWKSESDSDKLAAYATLYECLVTVSKLLAPTMPFVADTIYRNLVLSADENASPSVHLTLFPEADASLINQSLIAEMRLAQRLVSLGRAARENVNIGVRQPLASASFAVRDHTEAATVQRLEDLISSELNVKQVSVLLDAGSTVEYKLNPLPSVLGKKFGKDFPRVQKHLREGDAHAVRSYAEALLRGENIVVSFDDANFEAAPEEVEVKRIPKEGFAVAEDSGYVAALDVRLTDDLMMEGMAREVVRRVQTLRREADFDISDQIEIQYAASDKLAKAVAQFADYIQSETLAIALQTGEPTNGYHRAVYAPDPDGDPRKDTSIDGETLKLAVRRI